MFFIVFFTGLSLTNLIIFIVLYIKSFNFSSFKNNVINLMAIYICSMFFVYNIIELIKFLK